MTGASDMLLSRGLWPWLVVIALNVVGWVWAGANASLVGIGLGVSAYLFGLRHAFDADHIAAIDNATRKLVGERRGSSSVGLWFALGHSTIVLAASVLIVAGFSALGGGLLSEDSGFRQVAGAIGGSVAGLFLLAIAAINVRTLVGVVRVVLAEHRSAGSSAARLDRVLEGRGLLHRVLGRWTGLIDRPARMYPLGFLFGLGFDTASTIGFLVVSSGAVMASGAAGPDGALAAMAVPLLFTAGMVTGDTADAWFMHRAYRWAQDRTSRRARYNLLITGISVVAAVGIALPVLAGVAVGALGLTSRPLVLLAGVELEHVGFALVGLFVLLVGASALVDRRWWSPSEPAGSGA